MGFQDFSGSGVIHFFSGTCALVGAYVLGPRSGRFSAKGSPESHAQMNGHSIPVMATFLATNIRILKNLIRHHSLLASVC